MIFFCFVSIAYFIFFYVRKFYTQAWIIVPGSKIYLFKYSKYVQFEQSENWLTKAKTDLPGQPHAIIKEKNIHSIEYFVNFSAIK